MLKRNEILAVRADEAALLDDDERERIAAGVKVAKAKGKGRDLDDWIVFGRALEAGATLAQRKSGSNSRNGWHYNQEFARWKESRPEVLALDEGKTFSHLLFLLDRRSPHHYTTMVELRAGMTAAQLAAISHPTTMYKLVKQALKPPPSDLDDDLAADKEEQRKAQAVRNALARVAPDALPAVLLGLPPELLAAIRGAVCGPDGCS